MLFGFALPGDHMHAPDEHFGLNRIEEGFVTVGRALSLLGASALDR